MENVVAGRANRLVMGDVANEARHPTQRVRFALHCRHMDARLAKALKFSQEDLDANRSGRISAAQRAAYKPPVVASIAQWVLLGHFVLLAGIFGVIAIFTHTPAMWLILLLVCGLAGLPFFVARNEFLARPVLQDDIARGKVARACGLALLTHEGTRYTLVVEGIAFNVPLKVWSAFQASAGYCVYYLPNSRVLLTAEPLE